MTDWEAYRAARIALARTLLAEQVAAHGVVYLGQSLDEAVYQLYAEAGAPYGDGHDGMLLWLDDQLAARAVPTEENANE